MEVLFFAALVTALLAAGMALILAHFRPRLRPLAVGLIVIGCQSAIVIGFVVYEIAQIGPPGPHEIDAGGMAMAAFMILGTMQIFLCAVIGLPVAIAAASTVTRRRMAE